MPHGLAKKKKVLTLESTVPNIAEYGDELGYEITEVDSTHLGRKGIRGRNSSKSQHWRSHELQQAMTPCPSLTSGVCSDSCPSS